MIGGGSTAAAPADRVPAPLAALAAACASRAEVVVHLVAVDGAGRTADSAAVRLAAQRALTTLDPAAPTVARDVAAHHDDGRPVWPATATGSLAHAGGLAVAAVTARVPGAPRPAVGVDVEVSGALPAADARAVLTADEHAHVVAHPAPDREATRVWSAKEAAFKAWCEATDGGLGTVDPVDIVVTLAPDADAVGLRSVHVRATGPLAAAVAPVGLLTGWCADTGAHVLVLVTGARAGHHRPR